MKNNSLLLYLWLLRFLRLRSLLFVSLTTLSLAVAGYSTVAQAEEISVQEVSQTSDRLALPQNAIAAPVGNSGTAWNDPSPPPVDPGDQVANQAIDQAAPDSAAPDLASVQAVAPAESVPTEPASAPPPVALTLLQTVKTASTQKPVELGFGLASSGATEMASASVAQAPVAPAAIAVQVSNPEANLRANPFPDLGNLPLDQLFEGDSNSLVAKAVGSAEGTRTPDGDRNPAYYGHVDPGNKAWNQGSFSYQHGAASPEEADRKQLQRLQDQAAVLQASAIADGVSLTLEETLNGIDLANQSPKAALDRDGYIDWLAKAHAIGKTGEEAILWARAQSYFDPITQRWNAPGLGNTEDGITHDQARRMAAISEAIALYQQQAQPQVQQPAPPASPQQIAKATLHTLSEEIGLARLFQEKVFSPFSAPPETKQSMRSDESQHDAEIASVNPLFTLDLPAS
jgi:hypothetical protein